jgi:iron complex transport system ATP-binding protein
MKPLLSWKDICFSYGKYFEVQNATYDICESDFTIFFGPNGAGKTTLFNLSAGLLKPTSGCILLEGKILHQWEVVEIAKRIAYLEQEVQYVFPFTVEEIVLMGRFPHTKNQYWDRKLDFQTAAWAMETTGTLKFAKRSIFHLSGGERRKVEIARALCQKPKLLLLDEPTAFLDLRQQLDLFETLAHLNRDMNMAIVVITHQLELAKDYATSACFVDQGEIRDHGPAAELLKKEKIREYFKVQNKRGAPKEIYA